MFFLIAYLSGCLFFGWLAYVFADPYEHHSGEPWYKMKIATPICLFWPAYLVWIGSAWAWTAFFGDGD